MSRGDPNGNRRKRAGEQLPKLLWLTGGLCYWCKKPITMRRTIEDRELIAETSRSLRWFDVDGTELFALVATVDHVRSFEDGGNNYYRNLVASCAGCNGARAKAPGTGNHDRMQARIEERQEEAQNLRPLFKWLRRVGGHLTFGTEVRCFVEEGGNIVADYKHTDIVKAIKEVQARYNQRVMDRLGKGVGAAPQVTDERRSELA